MGGGDIGVVKAEVVIPGSADGEHPGILHHDFPEAPGGEVVALHIQDGVLAGGPDLHIQEALGIEGNAPDGLTLAVQEADAAVALRHPCAVRRLDADQLPLPPPGVRIRDPVPALDLVRQVDAEHLLGLYQVDNHNAYHLCPSCRAPTRAARRKTT